MKKAYVVCRQFTYNYNHECQEIELVTTDEERAQAMADEIDSVLDDWICSDNYGVGRMNNLTVGNLVIGRLYELQGLHKSFKGPVFFEMGQSLLEDCFNHGIEFIPQELFEYFEVNP